jgi:hypothetical protein
MMSRRRVVASITCVAIAGSACVASSGASSSSWFNQDQAVASAPSSGIESSPTITRAGGSANQEGGPRVSIYADVENSAGANLVRANFHLDDDAYVLVGHIDADGVLRIAFPETPLDNGFARGHASYQSAQFLGGFVGQYRARFTTGGVPHMSAVAPNDSYDGGLGWVFVIASWQPMRFEKFSTGGYWDSFELNDADYMKDPRPAVYELAALLAGTNSSSYTVRFANVHDTQTFYGGSRSLFMANNFGAEMCNGFGYGFSYGFASTPFGLSSFNPIYMYGYGQPFWWRGSQYFYDSAFDCYYSAGSYFPFGRPRGYGYGWGVIAQGPPTANPGIGRVIGIDQIRRPPLTPQPGPMRLAPGSAMDVGGATGSKMALAPDNTSPEYRTRGLVAHQDPVGAEVLAPRTVGPDRRARDAGNGFQTSGMVIRGGNDSRTQADAGNDGSSGRRAPSARGGDTPNASSPRVDSPRNDAPRAAPQPRVESPRSDAPRMAPAPAPRVESPRIETPRAASPPPPRVEAPRSEPAARSAPASAPAPASSSSSTGKPPGKN